MHSNKPQLELVQKSIKWVDYFPILTWIKAYNRKLLTDDLVAGIIVAIMLVPQGMAYAILAGLPPEVGLYASILPLILYGLLGTSRSLAVGPTAVVSLLVASSLGAIAADSSAGYLVMALTLALLVGIIQVAMGLLRIGFIVNFLSHPILSAFTSAAAILIGFSQLKHLFGLSVPRFEYFYQQVVYTYQQLPNLNVATLLIGLVSIVILLFFKRYLELLLNRLNLPTGLIIPLGKSGPFLIVIFGILFVMFSRLNETAGVKVVGSVPAGVAGLSIPFINLELIIALLPAAVTISIIGYMESISVAKSLASRKREKVDPNQELIALGVANLGAAFTGGYPVTGGISRSVVNFSAGAKTGIASITTALLVLLTVLFLTPLFYFLPYTILAAIILVAVISLVDFTSFLDIWSYSKADGIAWLVTFFAVLGAGVETGVLYGVGISIILFMWRTSQPHIAIVGRLNNSETYRNVLRHQVKTWPDVIAMRVDESLYFANTKYLEDTVLGLIADNPEVTDFILIGTAINFIDASALETLESLLHSLANAGVQLHLAAIKGPVLDKLMGTDLYEHLGKEHIFLTTHEAMEALGYIGKD